MYCMVVDICVCVSFVVECYEMVFGVFEYLVIIVGDVCYVMKMVLIDVMIVLGCWIVVFIMFVLLISDF